MCLNKVLGKANVTRTYYVFSLKSQKKNSKNTAVSWPQLDLSNFFKRKISRDYNIDDIFH